MIDMEEYENAQFMQGWVAKERVRLSDIENMRVRKSEIRNFLPLRTLCIKNIAKNMDNLWCKDFATNWSHQEAAFLLGPFDELPGCLVTDMINTLQEMNMLHFRYLLPVITCRVEVLDLSNSGMWTMNKILVAIRYRCKDLLKVLNLNFCLGLTKSILKDTLANLSNLQVLNLRQTCVGDDVVETIGSTMESLKELYLCNTQVTNKGVAQLCVDDGHTGKCKNLNVLTVDFTSVDAKGLLVALQNLPRLTILDNNYLSEAILLWHQDHPANFLQLQKISFDFSVISIEQLFEIVYVCPKLHILTFLPFSDHDSCDLGPFFNLPSVTGVNSQCSIIPSMAWFMHLGISLTHINLLGTCCDKEIDLTVIGKSCPNLVKLFIHELKLTETDFNLGYRHFRNMQDVSLQGNELCSFEKNLLCLFSSECIQSIKLILFQFHDSLLDKIGGEARTDRKILSQLTDFELWFCNQITTKGLENIILHAPRLKKLTVIRCKEVTLADFSNLENFIKFNKLDIKLNWT